MLKIHNNVFVILYIDTGFKIYHRFGLCQSIFPMNFPYFYSLIFQNFLQFRSFRCILMLFWLRFKLFIALFPSYWASSVRKIPSIFHYPRFRQIYYLFFISFKVSLTMFFFLLRAALFILRNHNLPALRLFDLFQLFQRILRLQWLLAEGVAHSVESGSSIIILHSLLSLLLLRLQLFVNLHIEAHLWLLRSFYWSFWRHLPTRTHMKILTPIRSIDICNIRRQFEVWRSLGIWLV